MDDFRRLLAEHQFKRLFIEELGWDNADGQLDIELSEGVFEFQAIAQKRGFIALKCPAHRTVLADRHLLRRLQRKLVKTYHEHLLVFASEQPRKQVWQWVAHMPDSRVVRHREHPFFSHTPPQPLLKRLKDMAFTLAEEESLSLIDAVGRVRYALDTLADQNLFVRWPSFAKRSDELAVAAKEGVPGAFEEFVLHHRPLAKKSSRMLVRWVGLDEDDAEQIAMLGVLEAARRFDPELGYQFSTYAGYWIRQQCQRHGIESGLLIRLPPHVFWPCYKLRLERAKLLAGLGPLRAGKAFDELRESQSVSPSRWLHFVRAMEVRHFSDLYRDEWVRMRSKPTTLPLPHVTTERKEVQAEVQYYLSFLNKRARHILKLRYGFDTHEHTLEEVGELLGITR